MHRFIRTATLAVAAALSAPAFASPATVTLEACLVAKSTVDDHKALARWFFVTMSLHPTLHDIFSLTPQARATIDKAAADVFVRLVAVDCLTETRAAAKVDGASAMGAAFSRLGQVAMADLDSNSAVQAQFEDLVRYMDHDKLKSAFGAH